MITKLEIEGFKSFGSPAEKIELGPLNFIVGANATGKTNLLHALRFPAERRQSRRNLCRA